MTGSGDMQILKSFLVLITISIMIRTAGTIHIFPFV